MRRSLWIGASLTVVASAVGLLVANPVEAGGPPVGALQASLSPSPAAPGATVSVSSIDPCPTIEDQRLAPAAGPVVEQVEWFLSTPDPLSPDDILIEGAAPLDGERHWEDAFTAPSAEGEYSFYAFCPALGLLEVEGLAPAGEGNAFSYGPIALTVAAAGEEFSASLDQASGLPGDDIELTGIRCAGDSGAAALLPVGTPPAHPDEVDEAILQQYDVLDGQFGGVVPVPADTEPGTYQVVTWCMGGDEVLDAAVLGYTVLAAAAPVPVAPTFTG